METNRTEILTYKWSSGRWQLQEQAVGAVLWRSCGISSEHPLRLVYDTGRAELLLLVPEMRNCR